MSTFKSAESQGSALPPHPVCHEHADHHNRKRHDPEPADGQHGIPPKAPPMQNRKNSHGPSSCAAESGSRAGDWSFLNEEGVSDAESRKTVPMVLPRATRSLMNAVSSGAAKPISNLCQSCVMKTIADCGHGGSPFRMESRNPTAPQRHGQLPLQGVGGRTSPVHIQKLCRDVVRGLIDPSSFRHLLHPGGAGHALNQGSMQPDPPSCGCRSSAMVRR